MHGDMSFIEIGTTNPERSRAFFEKIFGWKFHPMKNGGGWFQTPSMRIGMHGDDPSARMYTYFEVPDLEQAMTAVREAGGEADAAGPDEPGFGRFTSCRDPQGIQFGLHQKSVS